MFLANDSDTDAGPIAIIAISQPANGAVFITNNGADLPLWLKIEEHVFYY